MVKYYCGQWFNYRLDEKDTWKECILVKYDKINNMLYLYDKEAQQYYRTKEYNIGRLLEKLDKPADISTVLDLDIGLKGDKERKLDYNRMDPTYRQKGQERNTMTGSYGRGLYRGK